MAQRNNTNDMHSALFRAFIAFVLTAVCTLAFAGDINHIDVRQAQAMAKQGALLLDVREPHEYAEVRAPGSLLVPLGQLMSRVEEFRAFENKPILVICRSGARSSAAADKLMHGGFKSVYNVQGGIIAWEKAGLPVERR
jgi:rhodanese-related sulfurtransferase